MRRMWMVGCLLLALACSDSNVRSAALSADPDSVGPADAVQPMVMFRCEAGRLGAYLVASTGGGDADVLPENAIRVDLDSSPPCIASAP